MESYVLTFSGNAFLVIRAKSLDKAKEKIKKHYRNCEFEDLGDAKIKLDTNVFFILSLETI